MVADSPRSRPALLSWDTRDVTTQPQPAAKPAKPRLLQDGRDMFWSIAPLAVACIVLAGMAGMCTFAPGGTNRTVPSYDAVGALRADAQTLKFPVRLPRLPEGWQPSSGSRGGIENGRADPSNGQRLRAVTSTIGYLSPTGMYLSLTQSNADEDKLIGSIHPSPSPAPQQAMYPTGTVDIDGTRWIIYQGDGSAGNAAEPVWTTRLDSPAGPAQIAITGAGSVDQFRTVAVAIQSQPPLPAIR
jgi:hypothetical protein